MVLITDESLSHSETKIIERPITRDTSRFSRQKIFRSEKPFWSYQYNNQSIYFSSHYHDRNISNEKSPIVRFVAFVFPDMKNLTLTNKYQSRQPVSATKLRRWTLLWLAARPMSRSVIRQICAETVLIVLSWVFRYWFSEPKYTW